MACVQGRNREGTTGALGRNLNEQHVKFGSGLAARKIPLLERSLEDEELLPKLVCNNRMGRKDREGVVRWRERLGTAGGSYWRKETKEQNRGRERDRNLSEKNA